MSRKRRFPVAFEWIPVYDEEDNTAPLPDIRVKHTQLNLDEIGPSITRNSHFSAPASPKKKMNLGGPLKDLEQEPGHELPFFFEGESWDPEYVSHLDDATVNITMTRRKRTLAVCMQDNLLTLSY